MPSPIGHALAGVATAGVFRSRYSPQVPQAAGASSTWNDRFAILCAALAITPDLDLVYLPIHRTVTHSVTAIAFVMIVAAVVTGWVTRGRAGQAGQAGRAGKAWQATRINWRIVFACGVAYGSHVLMDWLGADASRPYGIQLFWPVSHEWFVAPWAIFPGTERRAPFSTRSLLINGWAAFFELTVMGAVAWIAIRAGKAGRPGGAGMVGGRARQGRQGGGRY